MSRVAVAVKGALEPYILSQGYQETISVMNSASAAGKMFILGDDAEDGGAIAIAIPNILSIKELEGEFENATFP